MPAPIGYRKFCACSKCNAWTQHLAQQATPPLGRIDMPMDREQLRAVLDGITPGEDIVKVTWKYNRSQFEHTEYGLVVATPGGTMAVNDRPITGTDGRPLQPVVHLQKVLLEEPPIEAAVPEWLLTGNGVIGHNTDGSSHYWNRGFRSTSEVKQFVRGGWSMHQPGTAARYPAIAAAQVAG